MLWRGRVVSFALVALGAVASGGSCAEVDDATPFPARSGNQQPPGGGAVLDETTACTRLVAAEEKARHRLNCPEIARAACPFYVRPAGTGCWTYSDASLSACEDALAGYEFCADLTRQRCILSATPADPGSCPVLGAGGEGGEGGGGGVTSGGQGGKGQGGDAGGEAGRSGTGAGGRAGSGQGGRAGHAAAGSTSTPAGGAGESGTAGAGG